MSAEFGKGLGVRAVDIIATATDPNGNTSQFSSTQLVTAIDSDGDGMPDNYEAAHPGATDPNGDNDGDGLTNLQEMFAGTDPLAASNRFQITLTAGSGNDIQITFRSVVGKPIAWNIVTTSLPGAG